MDYEKKYKQLHKLISDLYPYMSEFCKEKVEGFIPELKEFEDERIRKELIIHCRNIRCVTEEGAEKIAKWIAWLEKRGEQNESDVKDYNSIDPHFAKPIDKVEPKFKVGDWITSGRYAKLIVGINSDWPHYMFKDGTSERIKDIDKKYHLWTIKDAKDGDVLYSLDSNRPFIYKVRNDYEQAAAYCGLNIYGKFFVCDTKDCVITLSNYIPATKEQRDTLFAKMKEAGYKWDAENKELKKIEQNFAPMSLDEAIKHCEEKSCGNNACALEHKQLKEWLIELKELKEQKPWREKDEKNKELNKIEDEEYNGEDYGIDGLWHAKNILEETLGKVDGYQTDDGILEHKCAIAAVNKLYKQKPAEWSEEDEWKFSDILALLRGGENCHYNTPDLFDWLKSLKERCTWKPSDEQMNAFKQVYDWYNNNFAPSETLTSLYNDLKKLKGE